jgi:hypothetical protein
MHPLIIADELITISPQRNKRKCGVSSARVEPPQSDPVRMLDKVLSDDESWPMNEPASREVVVLMSR